MGSILWGGELAKLFLIVLLMVSNSSGDDNLLKSSSLDSESLKDITLGWTLVMSGIPTPVMAKYINYLINFISMLEKKDSILRYGSVSYRKRRLLGMDAAVYHKCK